MAVATAPRGAAPATVTATAYEAGGRRTSPTVIGAALAIVADLMIFAALLAAYYGLRASSFAWPPKGLSQPRYLATVITMTMVMGVASAQWAAHATRLGDRRNTLVALGFTMLFAVAVGAAEWYSFGRTAFGLRTNAYGTMHHVLIGFHLLNVLAAAALLAVVFVQALAGAVDERRPGAVSAMALFWHFITGVWLVTFFVLFLAD
jgi:heme/copper-type cytochrome/quinol oxidase subunit 3